MIPARRNSSPGANLEIYSKSVKCDAPVIKEAPRCMLVAVGLRAAVVGLTCLIIPTSSIINTAFRHLPSSTLIHHSAILPASRLAITQTLKQVHDNHQNV
jgi:hypothetical protein